jgi:hypothetical protein
VGLYFSDHFGVRRSDVEAYGAFDVSLVADLPLFIDPFLLFASDNPDYRKLHDGIIDYLRFLKAKAAGKPLDAALTKSLYSFKEVKQNWLGFTRSGNSGAGLGSKFARALHANLHSIFANFGSEKITRASHLEKLCLIDTGVGRDRISDFTTRLILEYLCTYTQTFAQQFIDPKLRKTFAVPRVAFNYEVQAWVPKKFDLPAFEKDFVILSPSDLLTRDDTWINRQDLFRDFEDIPEAIGNDSLRAQINDYFERQLPKEPTNKDVAKAIDATLRQHPELIDYYIRYKEDHEDEAKRSSKSLVEYSERVFLDQAAVLYRILADESDFYAVPSTTFEESLARLKYFKHVIEDRGGYRVFYVDGRPIEREQDVHVMFDLVWLGSPSDVNREVNNGRGPADFAVSRGSRDKTVIEFKLASNPQLSRNLQKQAEIYKKGGRAQHTIKVIVFFSELQEARVLGVLRGLKLDSAKNVVLIDARADNKPSASKA